MSIAASRSTSSGARARESLRDHVRAQQHHRAHLALGQQRADAGGVASHEIDLQLGEPVERNRDLGELAESGRHAVDDLAALDDVRNDLLSRFHPRPGSFSELDPRTVNCNRPDELDRQTLSVDDNWPRTHC